MKKRLISRLLCLVLVVAMLLQTGVMATDADQTDLSQQTLVDGEDPTKTDGERAAEPEKEKLDIGVDENWWSYPALYFAVENGILQGNASGDLTPAANATRAQMATILTRLIKAADKQNHIAVKGADLSAYQDVYNIWYYNYMSAAVQFGIFNGINATSMQPDGNITREQAFTVIGRTFGLQDGTKEDLAAFTDVDKVSDYAVPYIAALVKTGYVNGKTATTLEPKAQITREELAQVLYKIFGKDGDTICDGTDVIPASGTVVFCQDVLPDDTRIDGNLILSCDAYQNATDIEIKGLQLTGTLTIVLQDGKTLKLTDCSVQNIAVLSDTDVTCDSAVQHLVLSGAGTSYTSDEAANNVMISGANVRFTGNAKNVAISGNNCMIQGVYDKVTVTAANATAETGSAITKLILNCAGGAFTLDGTAVNAELMARDYTLQGSGKADTVMIYYGSQKITCKKGATDTSLLDKGLAGTTIALNTVKVSSASPTAKITATFSGVNDGTGTVNGYRAGQLKWYVDGTLKQTSNISVRNGSASTFSYTYTINSNTAKSSTIKAEFIYYGESISKSTTVTIDKSVSIPSITGRIAAGDYTTYEKETFVNAKGYSSNTKYLIWQNLYHTKVNVFYGSRGNWDLIKVFDCGIGANKPGYLTPTGQFRLLYRMGNGRWTYDWWYCDTITVYNGNYAFHTRGKSVATGAYVFNDLNVMISHGCTRMNTEDAKYIQNLPLGTKVVIY